MGRPGTLPNTASMTVRIVSTSDKPAIVLVNSDPNSSLAAARVTKMPAAVDVISAGICETKPSRWKQRESLQGFADAHSLLHDADRKPPSTLINVIRMAAMASPRTNLLAPSSLRKNRFLLDLCGGGSRAHFVDHPAFNSAIQLPSVCRHRVQRERAATSAMRPAPW